MQSQTLILAGIAAFYPVGLIAVGVLLATERALRLGLWFLAGAAVSLFVVGILVITLLHGAGLSGGTATNARGSLKIGLGIAMLIVGYVVARRPPSRGRQHDPAAPQTDKKEPSWQRRLRQAHPLSVFLTGTILYSPSATYVGAVQQIATSDSGWAPAIQLLIVIAIVLLTVEIPLLAYAFWPEATGRAVRSAEGWIELHQRETVAVVFFAIGGYLLIDGLIAVL